MATRTLANGLGVGTWATPTNPYEDSMSVTFSVANAPWLDQLEACMCAQDAPSEIFFAPAHEVADQLADYASSDCGLCAGRGTYSYRCQAPEHEFNRSNMNARALLAAIGIRDECLCGGLSASRVHDMSLRITKAIFESRRRTPHLRAAVKQEPVPASFGFAGKRNPRVVRKPGRAGFHASGLSDQKMLRDLASLLELCHEAVRLNSGICWS